MDNKNYGSYNQSDTLLFPEQRIVYGGFWPRFLAAFIDGIILGVVNAITLFIGGEAMPNVLGLIVGWLYYAFQEASPAGATLGKRALNLKVVTENGEQLSFGQATGRYFGKIISTIILLIGYLMMLWDEKKQTLHDKMVSAIVIVQPDRQ
ncbi:MAG TPA: RDD family protein [Flavisolibacter sp.]|nr:RDD family protein [Flavisolibacter sp.]